MNLQKWALVAEIVGGLAVICTLLLLIFEIRGNTEELRAASQANIAARTQALPIALMTNPQWADVYRRWITGQDLTPTERTQVFGHLITVLKLAEESYFAYRDGRLEEEIWQTRAELALSALTDDHNRGIWKTQASVSGNFTQEFVDWFDVAVVDRYGE